MRSATAPETMVTAVPQNMAWKTKKICSEAVRLLRPAKSRSTPTGRTLEAPKANMKPTRAKKRTDAQKSITFFMATLMEFLDRTMPASISRKPICMTMTSAAATITQTESRRPCTEARSVSEAACASADGAAEPRKMRRLDTRVIWNNGLNVFS